MSRTALFDAVREVVPGKKIKPEWIPSINAVRT